MANTYTQLTIQAVFAVKGRENLLVQHQRPRIFEFMTGILRQEEQTPLAVNGWQDHVHICFGLHPSHAIADIVREVKAKTSRWIKEHDLIPGKFEWQDGYAAFSYSRSQRDSVIKYIINQEKHHAKRTFREEYLWMLQQADVAYDEKYLFEFYD